MFKNMSLLLGVLIMIGYTMQSFAISPGAAQAQTQNNMQTMQRNQQQIEQNRQNQQQMRRNQQQIKHPSTNYQHRMPQSRNTQNQAQ